MWRLQNRDDIECRFFRGFSEDGHYGGRDKPTNTRQGIYCCTPAGRFLGSVNTVDPRRMERMLRSALKRFEDVPKEERLLDYDPAERRAEIRRRETRFPEDGLALRVYSRDMPREGIPDDWRREAFNVDSLWYRATEARALLPAKLEQGQGATWPEALARRLIRHNLVDNVRGQTNGYRAGDVKVAAIRTTVSRVKENIVTVVFEGQTQATSSGAWPKDGQAEGLEGGPWTRGVKTTLYGHAEFDSVSGRFVRFEIAARGTRFGRTRYNFRDGDVDEAPIGFAIVLDPADPGQRVAPAEMHGYGW